VLVQFTPSVYDSCAFSELRSSESSKGQLGLNVCSSFEDLHQQRILLLEQRAAGTFAAAASGNGTIIAYIQLCEESIGDCHAEQIMCILPSEPYEDSLRALFGGTLDSRVNGPGLLNYINVDTTVPFRPLALPQLRCTRAHNRSSTPPSPTPVELRICSLNRKHTISAHWPPSITR
jgi:hypothetical protein